MLGCWHECRIIGATTSRILTAVLWASVAFAGPSLHPYEIESGSVYGGLPVATAPTATVEVLPSHGFTVGYSEARRDPLWVAYHLMHVDHVERTKRPPFHTDDRSEAGVTTNCYRQSGYDRGHNAPNFAMLTRYGEVGQSDSFLLTNIAPQRPHLNRETWEAFEKVEVNEYAQRFGQVWSVTGPIFPPDPQRIACDIAVPVAFYKIVVREDVPHVPSMLAVIMSQHQEGTAKLRNFTTTVDAVEQQTGLDFFPDVPKPVQERVEAAGPDARWDVDQVLIPSRWLAESKRDDPWIQ